MTVAAAAQEAALGRLEELERRTAALAEAAPQGQGAARAAESLAADLRGLRDALETELRIVAERLDRLTQRVDDLTIATGLLESAEDMQPLTDEEEGRWVQVARDADPYTRFSALVKFGLRKTDRAVAVSIEALGDSHPMVVCRAAENLGRFRELAAARSLAALLDHGDFQVRQAAHAALLELGAPRNDYTATAPEEARSEPAAELRAWAFGIR